MKNAFDHIAPEYDESFTYTAVGMAQRKLVWDYLEKVLDEKKEVSVLELNCGTGEDAIWLAKKGYSVLATDISKEMVNEVWRKSLKYGLGDKMKAQIVDIKMIGSVLNERKFDLIFSNFGGLNCLSPQELGDFFYEKVPNLLKPEGKFIGVIMPKFCAWESFYFLMKLQLEKAFRRLSKKPLEANLGNGVTIKTWYFSPKNIENMLPENLIISHKQAVGFFIPPSYLNRVFEKRKPVLNLLGKLESWAIRIPFLSKMSDHFLIQIKQK